MLVNLAQFYFASRVQSYLTLKMTNILNQLEIVI